MAGRRVALLRAVNLGKRNKVPMAELRELFERAGCRSVRTYIQSGNVLFESDSPDRSALESAVAEAFGVQTVIVLRTATAVRNLAAAHPFGVDTSKSAVAFVAEKPPSERLDELLQLDVSPDRAELVGTDIAVRYPNGFQGARLPATRIEKHLGVPVTLRNWRTVARLAELASVD